MTGKVLNRLGRHQSEAEHNRDSHAHGKRRLIGLLRPNLEPPLICRIMAMMAPDFGLDIAYLLPGGIHTETDTLTGRMWRDGAWKRCSVPMPIAIDVSPYCLKRTDKIAYLNERTYLTDDRTNRVTKNSLHRLLAAEPEFVQYALRTERVEDPEHIASFVTECGEAVVKPIYSQRGAGVHRVRSVPHDSAFSIGLNTADWTLGTDDFLAYAGEYLCKSPHVIQEYVSSRSKGGEPFDCRLHVEKNGTNQWELCKSYVRVGLGQQVISNVNQGGGIADTEPFLKANRPETHEAILDELGRLAHTLPYYYEALRGRNLMTLGIDVGIDDRGALHIFEVNSSPGTESHKAETAVMRLEYYRYLSEHVVAGKLPFAPRTPWADGDDGENPDEGSHA